MTIGGEAGGSAMRKSEQALKAADRWHKGAVGELMTAEALAPLAASGFRVFHDLKVPGSKANIDHLVIGPTGVFAIDSKNHRVRMTYNKGTLWSGRYAQTTKLHRTRWEAEQASAVLGGTPVTAVQCIHGTTVPALDGPIEGVRVVDLPGLIALLHRGAPVLSPFQCTELVSRAVAVWSSWEPPTSRRPAPAPTAPAVRRSAPSTGPAQPRPQSGNGRSRGRRPSQPWWAELVEALLMLVFAWALLAKGVPAMMESITDTLPTTTTTTVAP